MDANLKCPMCDGQFNSQQELDKHSKEAHNNQADQAQEEHTITCSKCGMRAESNHELDEHVKQHSM